MVIDFCEYRDSGRLMRRRKIKELREEDNLLDEDLEVMEKIYSRVVFYNDKRFIKIIQNNDKYIIDSMSNIVNYKDKVGKKLERFDIVNILIEINPGYIQAYIQNELLKSELKYIFMDRVRIIDKQKKYYEGG